MHNNHASALDMILPGMGSSSLDRRGLLLRSSAGLAATALTLASLRANRAAAQTAVASPAATPAAGGESGYAPVNGLNLYYEIHGTGQPLILLHGGLLTIDLAFGLLIPSLAQNHQVVAVELQAHGHTADIDRPLSFEAMADDIAGLFAYLGIQRADFFGFSVGGGVTWQTAIRHPELVRKMVVASAPYRRDGWYPEVLTGMAAMNAEAAAAMTSTPLYEAYVKVAPKPEDWPVLVTKVGQLTANDYDWSEGIRSITAPVLIVIGDSDSVRPGHALSAFELLGGGVPGDFGPLPESQLAILPGTAHSPLLTRADLLLPILTPFLQ
jgi:pimeloyl-ACP methyl ester carboxylesterase